jgi:hypothetical protein
MLKSKPIFIKMQTDFFSILMLHKQCGEFFVVFATWSLVAGRSKNERIN